jgi:hypothetical protein
MSVPEHVPEILALQRPSNSAFAVRINRSEARLPFFFQRRTSSAQNFATPLELLLVACNCRDSLSVGHVQLTTPNLLKRQDALPLLPNCREPDRSRRGREAFRYRSERQAVGLLL